MPQPSRTKVFFWPCGVGYWGIHANSEKLAEQLSEPLPRFYLCGENYSSAQQQWVEGALETAKKICDKI
jgi:monoamine oxidase